LYFSAEQPPNVEEQTAKKKGCTDEAQPFDELDFVVRHAG